MTATRDARIEDAPAIGRVHIRAWQAAYRGLMPDAYLDGLSAEERAAMWSRVIGGMRGRARLLVAEHDGEVVGFAGIGPAGGPDADGPDGELYVLNVDPAHWHAGVGRALLDVATRALLAAGFAESVLWVHPENHRARRLYERAGWSDDGAAREADVLGVVVPEVRHRLTGRAPGTPTP